MTLTQTKAALILQQLSPLIEKKCTTDLEYVYFMQQLCKAYFNTYSKYPAAYAEKTKVIFSFTNASYFMRKDFTSVIEDGIFNTTVFEQPGENIPGVYKQSLEDYFQKSLIPLFEFEYTGGLHIVATGEAQDLPGTLRPDWATLFKKELPDYKILLQQKPKVLTANEYREFLVYYLVKQLYACQEKNGVIPVTLLNEAYQQIELLSMDIFQLPYKFISPAEEIFDNCSTRLLLDVTNKYFQFLEN